MLKKMMLLASFALAAVAFAAPATASAEWTHETKAITSDTTIEFTGFAEFTVHGAPIHTTFGCDVHVMVTLTSGTTDGHVDSFEITTSTCKGTGVLTGCALAEDETTGTPWAVHNNEGKDIIITNVLIDNVYEAGTCPAAAETKLSFPEVTATVDDPHAINHVTLEGTGKNLVTGGPVTAGGTLQVTPAGTYGIT